MCITDTDINKHAGPKLNAFKRGAIRSQCHLVITATLIVVPGTGFHMSLGKSFIVENVDRFQWAFPLYVKQLTIFHQEPFLRRLFPIHRNTSPTQPTIAVQTGSGSLQSTQSYPIGVKKERQKSSIALAGGVTSSSCLLFWREGTNAAAIFRTSPFR